MHHTCAYVYFQHSTPSECRHSLGVGALLPSGRAFTGSGMFKVDICACVMHHIFAIGITSKKMYHARGFVEKCGLWQPK